VKYVEKGIIVEDVNECTPLSAIPVVWFGHDPLKHGKNKLTSNFAA
jgi:hypothetical protein